MSVEEKLPLMHDMTYREAQTMFIDHVRQVMFVDHEIITLQGLLHEYKSIMGTYGLPNLGIKSSYVKEMLMHEFGDGIGFHIPPRKNQSEVVYDTSGSSSYIEAVISLLGIDNDQLVQNWHVHSEAYIQQQLAADLAPLCHAQISTRLIISPTAHCFSKNSSLDTAGSYLRETSREISYESLQEFEHYFHSLNEFSLSKSLLVVLLNTELGSFCY